MNANAKAKNASAKAKAKEKVKSKDRCFMFIVSENRVLLSNLSQATMLQDLDMTEEELTKKLHSVMFPAFCCLHTVSG